MTPKEKALAINIKVTECMSSINVVTIALDCDDITSAAGELLHTLQLVTMINDLNNDGETNMLMSADGVAKLTEWEGSECEIYEDSAGHETIGVGHLLTSKECRTRFILIGESLIDVDLPLEESEINLILLNDLKRFEEAVNLVEVKLSQHQYDALVSFSFNVGVQAFRDSTLLRQLNLGLYDSVPTQLKRWNKASGKVVQGLINRRENEIALWLEK